MLLTEKCKVMDADARSEVAEMIGKGMNNKEISDKLKETGKKIAPGAIETFRKKVLSGVIECKELDKAKPATTILAENYNRGDALINDSFKELADRMNRIDDDVEWLEFLKEKRQFIELLLRKSGELESAKNAVQVNIANLISPDQFMGKANEYLFSQAREGRIVIIAPDLKQEYEKWNNAGG